MEDCSINSSVQKSVDDEEESGWTAYFEDFSNDHHHHQDSYCSSVGCSSSLISDAATTAAAAWKTSHNNNSRHHQNFAAPKKIRFKKTRTKEICDEDDSLEDTASSPVNSPKVSDLKSNDMNLRKREDHQTHSSLGKEAAWENYSERQIEEQRKMIGFDHHEEKKKNSSNDCAELKKRGLCLVPLSMLVNYLG